MKDLSWIFIFLPVNSGLSSKKRGGRGRYQVRLLPALWFHLGALGSTYPHTSSLLSGPAASDLTVQQEQSGPLSYFLLVPLRASSFYLFLHTSSPPSSLPSSPSPTDGSICLWRHLGNPPTNLSGPYRRFYDQKPPHGKMLMLFKKRMVCTIDDANQI